MNIRMYNCYFGDCFKIANDSGNDLLVDMGIHKSSTTQKIRENIFDYICKDLSDSTDFLLSHYHYDHYNGAVYINSTHDYKFSDVYIPDIWSFNGSIPAVSLHLLRMILDKSILKTGTTIFDFLKSICKSHSTIHFVQRGTDIQDKYIALWPSDDYISKSAEELFAKIKRKNGINNAQIERLTYYSNNLRQLVLTISSGDYIEDNMIVQINSLEEEFKNEEWGIPTNDFIRRIKVNLSDFGNNISIVFQNKDYDIKENLLFTGDFCCPESLWGYIETNYDNKDGCDMHSTYHAIKVGHHGTRSYYHTYVARMNSDSILMIPNGNIKRWSICSDYALNTLYMNSNVVCSMDNACEAKNCCNSNCPCVNKTVMGANFFSDII